MSYDKRLDGRKFEEMRPITAKVGVIKKADGSAMFKIGNTIAYAAAYGPREMFPRFKQNPERGTLRINYNMLPFSGMGDRVRPGQNRRAKEISLVITKALEPVVDLSAFPNSVVDVFVELPQTDAGSRCAAICAASMALADAGIIMTDMVGSVAVGRVDDKIVADLDYAEEAYEDGTVADIPVAMTANTGEVTLLQMDGEITREQLKEALEMARAKVQEINAIQRQALKDKFAANSGDKQ